MGTTNDLDLEKWMMEVEQEEEEAEDALATGLKSRPPRTPPPPAEEEEEEEEEQEVTLVTTKDSAGVKEGVALVAEPQVAQVEGGGGRVVELQSERSIYFDTQDGTAPTNGASGMKYSVVDDSVEEKKLGNGECNFTPNGVDTPKSQANETNYGSQTNLKDEVQSALHPESSENGSAIRLGAGDDPHLKILIESKEEVAEWDVERVLDKQDTHDLYCPNCHSCITKRVILRKRKRRLQNPQFDAKREKIEVLQSSSVETNSQSQNTTLPGLDGSPPSIDTNDQDRGTGPDLFRCLSCFSFFIPSVASFRSFRIFGNRRERESARNIQQRAVGTTEDNQGVKDATHHDEEVGQGLESQHPLNHQRGQVSSVNGATLEPQDDKNDFLLFSTTSQMMVQDHVEEVAQDLKSQYPLNHQSYQVSSVIPAPNESLIQPVNGVAVECQDDEKDFIVSSTTSVTVKKVKNDVEEIPHGTFQKNLEDEKNASPAISRDSPLSVDSHANKHMNISTTTTNVWNDEQNGQVSSMSVNIHLVEYRFETDDQHKDASKRTQDKHIGIGKDFYDLPTSTDTGEDVRLLIEEQVPQSVPYNIDSSTPALTYGETAYRSDSAARTSMKWDILKSIVYGGLVESVASLGVVSSAAGGDATTLNIVALGLAYLVGGLFIIVHGLMDLKNEQYGGTLDQDESIDRYQELLGQRTCFKLHASVAILSYIVFGLVAPVTYGFSFRESDNKEYKLIAVVAVSILCIILLAIGKVYVQKPPKAYIKTVMYYIGIAVMSSGLSYAVGMLVKKFLEKVGWFEPTVVDPVTFHSSFVEPMTVKSSWALF